MGAQSGKKSKGWGNARNSEYMRTPSGLNCIPRKKEESREICTVDMDNPFVGESKNIRWEGPLKDLDDLIRPRWQRKGPQ